MLVLCQKMVSASTPPGNGFQALCKLEILDLDAAGSSDVGALGQVWLLDLEP